jgi:hypothetical protein
VSTLTEIPEHIAAQVSSIARQLRGKYRGFVELEDIQQELYIWYVRNHHKVSLWEEEHHEKSAARLVAKSLRNHGEKYCRREKASVSGYEPEDEFFYTIPMCADMLQLYFDPEWMEPRALELTTTSSGKPANEGWNLQAMVADVGRAYEALPASDRDLLQEVYGGAVPVRDAIAWKALEWDITANAADHRIRRVVGRLRAKLGGPRPHADKDDE